MRVRILLTSDCERDQQTRLDGTSSEASGDSSRAESLLSRGAEGRWDGLNEVRQYFPSADQVGKVLIFDVLGDNYRLITAVDYPSQRLFIKTLLTHREYDRKGWMKWA
jgi:mRNA-degrading endonuclease HigB of HigAB toxin-antitoxin module